MFGEDILFAPVMQKGQRNCKVYLPEGKWVSVIDKKEYEGRQTIEVQVELDQFAAFVKQGSSIIDIF